MSAAEGALLDPPTSARAAGLLYVDDRAAGIRRIRAGKGFRYRLDGKPLRDPGELARIRALAIPPAWTGVWICPLARGHLQAAGRDAKGRKQYRYHPRWRQIRDETKFHKMIAFAEALPKIRARVAADLARTGLPREKVLAAVVRLLEETRIRVGNEEYVKENGSYGLTTLTNRHVGVRGGDLRFSFRGKSGVQHRVSIHDPRLARIVSRMRDLPGQALFEWVDDEGRSRPIDSGDVNDYLREISGDDLTAKDFRTWAGTVLAAGALSRIGEASGVTRAKGNLLRAVDEVAHALGNTRAVCRKSYIHPAILDGYLDGTLLKGLASRSKKLAGLTRQERAVLFFLRRLAAAGARELPALLEASLEKVSRGVRRRAAARRPRARRAGARRRRARAASPRR